MAERLVCEACAGFGQTRASAAGPWSVCVVCQGAGRVDAPVVAEATGALAPEPAALHAGHFLQSREEDGTWRCATCPDHPLVAAPVRREPETGPESQGA